MTRWSVAVSLVAVFAAHPAAASLIGSEFSTQVIFQPTATSEPSSVSFEATRTVRDNLVEFPSLASLEDRSTAGPLNLFVVDSAIDVGDDFIEIDYSNAGSGVFASGFFNGYRFEFDSDLLIGITDITIDEEVTNLALTDASLAFAGTEFFLNAAGLPFNEDSFVRLNLEAEVVPLPAGVVLLGSAIGGLYGLRQLKRKASKAR